MRHHVLIVDPNEAFATMLRQSLQETGTYNASVVDSGRKALRAIASDDFDMVIVDLGLDDVDGSLLVRRLREDYPRMRLMVIPLFGQDPPEEISSLDIQGILPKPFFLPELPNLISDAMAKPVGPQEPPAEELPPAPKNTDEGTDAAANGPFPWDIDLSSDDAQEAPPAAPEKPAPKPEPAAEPAAQPVAETPAPDTSSPLPDRIAKELTFLTRQMTRLLQEVSAEAAILVNGNHLVAQVSRLPKEEVDALATVIQESWQTSARVAKILGKEQLRFEQSIEGDEHLLYSLALSKDLILSVVVEGRVALGIIRHRSKEVAEAIRKRLGIVG
ncbi:MAG: response regulator [Anaerolineae bacterium]|nr:response regulator [Anaerolineae bacterium]